MVEIEEQATSATREAGPVPVRAPTTWWLTRFVILRLLGLVYAFAFLALANQVLPLIGSEGLLPARLFLARVADHFGSSAAGAAALPSLFWLHLSDPWLLAWPGSGSRSRSRCCSASPTRS